MNKSQCFLLGIVLVFCVNIFRSYNSPDPIDQNLIILNKDKKILHITVLDSMDYYLNRLEGQEIYTQRKVDGIWIECKAVKR